MNYFRELYVNHNHLFYYKDADTIIIAEMFGEKEKQEIYDDYAITLVDEIEKGNHIQ